MTAKPTGVVKKGSDEKGREKGVRRKILNYDGLGYVEAGN